MKILIVTSFNYPHEGGLSTHITTLKNGLEKRGHQVDVLSFNSFHPFKKIYAQAPGYLLNKIQKGFGQLKNDFQRSKLLLQRLDKIVAEYDVINTQDVFATLAAVKTKIPVVATVHGYYAYEAVSRGAIEEGSDVYRKVLSLEKQAYESVVTNVTVDQRINNYIVDQADTAKRTTIKNFIDVDLFKDFPITKSSSSRLLFIPRRLTKKNGVIYPLYALHKILEEFPDTQLVYAGSGEEMSTIRSYVQSNSLGDHVKLLGSVPHQTMLDWYQKADITIIPSVHSHGVEEATSISALEAMASGTPVIASAIGGLKQIISTENDGLLVEEKNPEILAQAVIKLFNNQDLATKLASNAREKILQDYSHLTAADKFEKIYIEAIENTVHHA